MIKQLILTTVALYMLGCGGGNSSINESSSTQDSTATENEKRDAQVIKDLQAHESEDLDAQIIKDLQAHESEDLDAQIVKDLQAL